MSTSRKDNIDLQQTSPDSPEDRLLSRFDQLSDRITRRIGLLEERVRHLEQDNGEIINLLIAVKAGLEQFSHLALTEGDDHEESAPPHDRLH